MPRHPVQYESPVAVICTIALIFFVLGAIIVSLGIGLLTPFGLGVVGAICGVIFVVIFISEWKRSNRA